MCAWMGAMGLADNGKNYATVADQSDRIQHCLLSVQLTAAEGRAELADKIIRGAFQPFDEAVHQSSVELSEGFFETISAARSRLSKAR